MPPRQTSFESQGRPELDGAARVISGLSIAFSRAAPPDDALGLDMLLTQCAACAVPLPRPAKQCSRCKTLYCGPACQKEHWDAGGHDKLCKKIKKIGGAEQYHADKKAKEAVAEAVEECADDTKGQTCFICTQAIHWKTKEGLVRGCSCRGTAGFAHVSCLAEQAKIWVEEARMTIWAIRLNKRDLGGGTRVACASKTTMAWWRARSGGRAGRRTWAGRRWTGLGVMQCSCLGTVYPLQITMRMHCL